MGETEIRSCEEALRVLAAHLDGELDSATEGELERHLARCRSCYSRAEFEKRLKRQVAELGAEPVRAPLAERVQNLIARFSVTPGD